MNKKSHPREWNSWRAMCGRCRNPNATNYHYYGGRGITVHPAWVGKNGFENFLGHIGPKPDGDYTVGRIRGTIGYIPGNVRWETRQQQSANRDGFCVYITHDGKTQTLAEWGKDLGIPYETLRSRYKRNLPTGCLLETGRSRSNPQPSK